MVSDILLYSLPTYLFVYLSIYLFTSLVFSHLFSIFLNFFSPIYHFSLPSFTIYCILFVMYLFGYFIQKQPPEVFCKKRCS